MDEERDLNEYGRFESFYKPGEEKEEEKELSFVKAPRTRPNPFIVSDNRGSLMYKEQQ
jgi:hypothetical protein